MREAAFQGFIAVPSEGHAVVHRVFHAGELRSGQAFAHGMNGVSPSAIRTRRPASGCERFAETAGSGSDPDIVIAGRNAGRHLDVHLPVPGFVLRQKMGGMPYSSISTRRRLLVSASSQKNARHIYSSLRG